MSDNSIRPKLSQEQRERLVQEWRKGDFEPRILIDTNDPKTTSQCFRELREAWLALVYEVAKAIGVVWVLDRLERALRRLTK